MSHFRGVVISSVLFAAFGLLAQERFGELSGTVVDVSGALIPNVNVIVTNRETLRETRTQTGSDGSYVVYGLPPGFAGRFGVKLIF
jgi:hypothetical protein